MNKNQITISANVITNQPLSSRFVEELLEVSDELVILTSKDTKKEQIIPFDSKKIFVYNETFQNYADMRNKAIEKSRGKWILALDSDELLSPELRKRISELVNDAHCDAFAFKRIHYVDDPPPLEDYWSHKRLFRSYCRYFGTIHETLGGYKNLCQVECKDCFILHFNKRAEERKKSIKRVERLKKDLERVKKEGNKDLIRYYEFKLWVEKEVYQKETLKDISKEVLRDLYKEYEKKKREVADVYEKIIQRKIK